MKISSLAFGDGKAIPRRYTCDGDNMSPPLSIKMVPASAKSLVLILDDPDSPSKDFLHWILWNADPRTAEVEEGSSLPESVRGINDFGEYGYGGPCPSRGEHRYKFRLYALDTTLDISPSAKRAEVEMAMRGHVLEQAELVGLYKRD
ncbi:MAG: YbhB/YbcL family Raf kinase inhibitor-like protein [Patescibacteria group bacterium]|nr:YbhB/YbcL family Raf kinase inhibitor-like protein [Patescibacteria group bacterium]MCL5224104.1 YbhB/YbcL family Raf kinase inhibitor-like protein [Patescibacteria group bacterium]